MATPPFPDDSGVLAGPAHDVPGADGDAVVLPSRSRRSEIDPLVPAPNREGS